MPNAAPHPLINIRGEHGGGRRRIEPYLQFWKLRVLKPLHNAGARFCRLGISPAPREVQAHFVHHFALVRAHFFAAKDLLNNVVIDGGRLPMCKTANEFSCLDYLRPAGPPSGGSVICG